MIEIETGLKEESLKNGHIPVFGLGTELFGLRTKDLIEINGTIESEGGTGQLSKSSFNLSLDNTDSEYSDLGFGGANGSWNPSNSSSINKFMYFSGGYKNSGLQQSVFLQKGQIRDFLYNSSSKTGNLWCIDDSINFIKEIGDYTNYENKTPGQIIQIILNINGYLQSNLVGEKKLYFHYIDTLENDEIEFKINNVNLYKKDSFNEIDKLIQIGFGKLYLDRFGDIHYSTLQYILSKSNGSNDYILTNNPIGNEYPLFDFNVNLNYNNIYNNINSKIYTYKKQIDGYNFGTTQIQIGVGENISQIFELEGILKGTFTYDIFGSRFDDGGGVDYSSECVINITNYYKNLKIDIENNSEYFLYITINFYSDNFYKIGNELKINKKDTISINNFGENLIEINNEYIQSDSQGMAFLTQFLDLYKNPKRIIDVETVGLIDMELYDKVNILNLIEKKNFNIEGIVKRIKWKYSRNTGFTYNIFLDLIENLDYNFFLEKFENTTNFDSLNSENVEFFESKLQLEKIEITELSFTDEELYNDLTKTSIQYFTQIVDGELKLTIDDNLLKTYSDSELYNDLTKTSIQYFTQIVGGELKLSETLALISYDDTELFEDSSKTSILSNTEILGNELKLTTI